MSNETDLDWLARNVHVWPAGDHQPWCYVYWKGGHRAVSASCITVIQPCVRIEKAEWLARRAELQNKPSWALAPEWADWLAQDTADLDGIGAWWWYRTKPTKGDRTWSCKGYSSRPAPTRGEVLGDWRNTLEKRPEQAAFTPFTNIEDNQEKDMTQQQEMKQDNGWFKRGELPPAGARCEALSEPDMDWLEVEVIAHRDGFAIVWCSDERCGANCDDPKHFRPIRTERDVLIEMLADMDGSPATAGKVADAILAAGFSLGDK